MSTAGRPARVFHDFPSVAGDPKHQVPFAPSAIKGLLIGSAAGARVVSAINASDPETGDAQEYILVALVGAGMGALPGAGGGALVKTPRWAELPVANIHVTVAPSVGHGVGLRFAWMW